MLEFDDIQHILLTRAPALTGRYEFLSFRDAAAGRAWLSAIKEKVHSVAAMRANVERDKRWVTVAFTWNGLRALGLDEASLATFPGGKFSWQGMVARAGIRSAAYRGKPAQASNIGSDESREPGPARDCYPIRDAETRPEHCSVRIRARTTSSPRCPGVELISPCSTRGSTPSTVRPARTTTSATGTGCPNRLSKAAREDPTPGLGRAAEGRAKFILRGYPDEYGVIAR